MIFTRLRLVGFKSFAEPAEFLIEPGLTGVVGPNGCGKSNLVEGLRWVMGEASHKAMRADDMNDVIFGGTASRPSRNIAEATLTIDNHDRSAPAAFNGDDILEVSRRIVRDDGSSYRINGLEARARDVQLLFADAASGARSPAMVRQGQIAEIITAKPESRRRILEEAAGITGLHARRRDAELRLEAAERNLARLDDILAQMTQGIDSLKRQARMALRYRQLTTDIRRLEAFAFYLRWQALLGEQEEAEALCVTARTEALEADATQTRTATGQAAAAAALPKLREEEARAAAGLHKLALSRDGLDRDEASLAQNLAALERRQNEIDRDIAHEKAQVEDREAVLARLDAEENDLAALHVQAEEQRAVLLMELDAARILLTDRTARHEGALRALADLSARARQLEAQALEQRERLSCLERDIAAAERDMLALNASSFDVDGLTAAVAHAQEKLTALEAASGAAESAHARACEAVELHRAPYVFAERELHLLETETGTLSTLLDAGRSMLFAPVISALTVTPGYEAALGAALGENLDASLDRQAPLRWVLLPLEGDPPLPSGCGCLADYVTAPSELIRGLRQIGVVCDAAQAEALLPRLRPGQSLVSLEGDLWRWDGLIMAAGAPTLAVRRLAETRRLHEAQGRLAEAQAAFAPLKQAYDAAVRQAEDAAHSESLAREALREARGGYDAARDALLAAEASSREDVQRRASLLASLEQLTVARVDARGRLEYLKTDFESLSHFEEKQQALEAARADLQSVQIRVSGLEASLSGLEHGLAGRQSRLETIGGERTAWRERAAGAENRIALLTARAAETQSERERLEDVPAQIARRRRELAEAIDAAEARRQEHADRLAEAETALRQADQAARQAQMRFSKAREEVARAEERHMAATQRRQDLTREITETLDASPQELMRLAGLATDEALPDATETSQKLAALKAERERLGAVNLRAELELQEAQREADILMRERDDLLGAIATLRGAIGNLNAEARERLHASFSRVHDHFQSLFQTLFEGGEAELQLSGSADYLEAGLEILARPPGKTPQTLSLLSGGEQALTAMALVFAVFLTNPAPLCVLDEVDAPLDDANIERFCALLDDMTRRTRTQFIIITHNPITMSRMDRLYGVTMVEQGVSRLVSVDLRQAVEIGHQKSEIGKRR